MDARVYAGLVRRAAARIGARAPAGRPRVALVLGSGLSAAAPSLEGVRAVPYEDIPGFPTPTVEGHEGPLLLGRFRGRSVAVMRGRLHYYEGHPLETVTLPLRALAAAGVRTVVLTAAVGSLRPGARPGHFVVIEDHLNFMGVNPLRGLHGAGFGPMFPSLTDAYDPGLRRLALKICRRRAVPARAGVYAAVSGPSYETPAEIRALRRLGADAVGMSVAPEAIVARQLGVRVLALGCVSNMAAGMPGSVLDHRAVLALGERSARRMRAVLEDLLGSL